MANTKNLPVLTPDGGLARYLQEIRQFPMLEPEEEYMLAKSWREHNDTDAAHKLVTSHLRLVAKIAMGYRGYGLPIGARFHSSGCVRVQNVRELITWLLQPNGWDRAQVDQTIRSGQRLDVSLDQPTQILFAYITAWVNADGVVHFRDDIYRKDGIGTLALR